MQETRVQSLGWEDPLEKKMATHSNILALEILWTEEQSMESQRVGHNLATKQPLVRTPRFHFRSPGVQSLAGELRSCKLGSKANKTKQNKSNSSEAVTLCVCVCVCVCLTWGPLPSGH